MLIKTEPWNTGAAASTEVALEVAVCESSEFKLKCWGAGAAREGRFVKVRPSLGHRELA